MRSHLGLLALIWILASGCSTPRQPIADEAAVRAANNRYIELHPKADVAQLIEVYDPEAMLLPPGEAPISGVEAIRTYWASFFDEWTVERATSELDEIIVSGDLAFGHGRYVETMRRKVGGPTVVERGKFSGLWRKSDDGRWRIFRDMYNADAPVKDQSPASAPATRTPEIARLEAFIGTWVFDGEAGASPYGPAGSVTGTDVYSWLPGGFFLEHAWDIRQAGTPIIGKEFISYDTRRGGYDSRFFENYGNTGQLRGTVRGDTWTWLGESVIGGTPLKDRGTLTIAGDSLKVTFEFSLDGGATWGLNFRGVAHRVRF